MMDAGQAVTGRYKYFAAPAWLSSLIDTTRELTKGSVKLNQSIREKKIESPTDNKIEKPALTNGPRVLTWSL